MLADPGALDFHSDGAGESGTAWAIGAETDCGVAEGSREES